MAKRNITRRNFLKISAVAGLGALAVPAKAAEVLGQTTGEAAGDAKKIPTRILGRTGIEMPILSMGADRPANPDQLLKAAFNSGIIHFDTGYVYQNGRNEEIIGNFLKTLPREKFFIATKVPVDEYPNLSDNFEEEYMAKVDMSLKRLQVDHVDLFYFHGVASVAKMTDKRITSVLQKIKDSGKARAIGYSSHKYTPELLDSAVEAGVYDAALISYNFKMDNIEELDKAIERTAKAGIGYVAMKTMAGGVEDAEGKKHIDGAACLKWVWKNPNIVTVIPGMFNYDQLNSALDAACDSRITPKDELYLAELKERETLYCLQCGECSGQCPNGLPVPDLMRSHMYAYGYRYARQAKETLAGLGVDENACSNCETCSVKCRSGFDIRRKIAAITPLVNTPDEFLT